MGLGSSSVSSFMRVPLPAARIIAFIRSNPSWFSLKKITNETFKQVFALAFSGSLTILDAGFMKSNFSEIAGSITAPEGFLAAGVFCDIKRLGTGKGSNKGKKRDLALILSEVPATVAGMFTTSQVCAAPVKVSMPRAQK